MLMTKTLCHLSSYSQSRPDQTKPSENRLLAEPSRPFGNAIPKTRCSCRRRCCPGSSSGSTGNTVLRNDVENGKVLPCGFVPAGLLLLLVPGGASFFRITSAVQRIHIYEKLRELGLSGCSRRHHHYRAAEPSAGISESCWLEKLVGWLEWLALCGGGILPARDPECTWW